jgi:hypothetical protein
MSVNRGRAAIKFLFWATATVLVFAYAIRFYQSGTMVHWYYYKAKADGFAVNTKMFKDASPEMPAVLDIGDYGVLDGLKATRVNKGDVLPTDATGVIDLKTVEEGKRVQLLGSQLKVLIPWQFKEAKGFKYKDSFTHKNIRTNPVSGVWNLVMVGLIGLCLGYLAEGFTDLIGLKFHKIDHTVGH